MGQKLLATNQLVYNGAQEIFKVGQQNLNIIKSYQRRGASAVSGRINEGVHKHNLPLNIFGARGAETICH